MTHSPHSPSDRLRELLPDLMIPSPRLQEVSFLRLQLSQREQGLIPMSDVRESLLVSARQISPVPNMSAAFLGLMSSRNQVFGIVDLPLVLGLAQGPRARQVYQIIVVSTAKPVSQQQQFLMGLAVPKIEGVSRIATPEPQTIPTHIPTEIHPAISGALVIESKTYLLISPPALTTLTTLSIDRS